MSGGFTGRGHLWLEPGQRNMAVQRGQDTDLGVAARRGCLKRLEKVGITKDFSDCTSKIWTLL